MPCQTRAVGAAASRNTPSKDSTPSASWTAVTRKRTREPSWMTVPSPPPHVSEPASHVSPFSSGAAMLALK